MTKELKVEAATTSFPVVGIGTSAGGLSALEDFFDNMPNNAGAAFVVIQHLAPDFKSLMRELLKKYTDMRVEQVEDGVELEPNCIFLIPPGQNLELQDNALRLTAQNRDSGHSIHFPINTFFRSLSVARKDKAIGIILSGTGSDGSKGIHAISEQGGIVMVQSPETAEFDGMPLSAIATSIPDFVLHARELALTTSQIIASPSQRAYLQASILNGSQLDRIISLLNNYENIDFTHYKTGTLERQITRRCALSGNLSIEQYTQQLEQSAEEREILRDALLITVTHFLRDIEAWQYLKSEVLPKIVEQGKETGTIRIWVTACATGEEAYSIAILLSELLPAEQNSPIEIKIFATDIDPIALRKASQGTYSADTMKNLTAEQIQRFFTQKESGFEVSRSLREMVIFANHNLIKDAVFTKIDLVSCRNILIYLQPALQQQVLHNLHFSLKQQGILFLGESENIGALEGEFIPVHRKWNIYQKSRNSRLPALSYLSAYRGTQQLMQKTISAPPQTPKFDPLIETAFTALLQDRFATCILVDRDNQVLHVCGDALELLRVATGRVSQDLFKMLPNSLHLPLSTALHRARLQDNKVHYRDCQITEEGYEVNRVSVEVSKQKSQSVDSFLMVLIEATSLPKMLETAENFESDQETAQYILQLQHELQANRENLQATVEELEVINEEQQATNEELTASNEELQSTNEELHSVNEELYTVNSEYQLKIQELTELNNDLDNLIDSIDIGVVYLDDQLCVRKFTPAATLTFNLVDSDIGRPLQHLSHNLEDFDTTEVLVQASEHSHQPAFAVKTKAGGPHLLMQIFPYVNENKVNNGLIVTLVNVNEMKITQEKLSAVTKELNAANEALEEEVQTRTIELRESQKLLQSITQSTPNGIYVYDLEMRQNVYANSFIERLLGYSQKQIQDFGDELNARLFHPNDVEKIEKYHQEIVESSVEEGHVFAIEYRVRDSSGRWHDFYSQDTVFKRDEEGRPLQIIGMAIDVSDRKTTSLQLQESETRYRQLYQNAPVMMHSIDLEGNILHASGQWLKRLGYNATEILNKPITTILSDAFKPDSSSGDQPLWLRESGCEQFDCQFICKNGDIIDVQLSAVPDKDTHGKVQRLLTVLMDVTERNKAEKEIHQYREHLEELVASRANQIKSTNQRLKAEINERIQAQAELDRRAKSLERSNADLEQFAYVVSHDLQEPIRAMTVFSQLLQQRYQTQLDTTAGNYIVNIVEGGIRMQALIDGILDFSRLTHRGQQFKQIALGPLVETVINSLKAQLIKNEATVTVDDLPMVQADENQISQLFQNLISNAIKFKGSEPPVIHITAKAQTDTQANNGNKPPSWIFGVTDNGIGIPEDQQERIFALFQRLHTRQELEGYGIGLAICKKIIERHNGSIWVKSSPGKDTSFFFTLSR